MGWVERMRAEGSEPDPRFSFANERTFLAWIRTALAVMAAGIALETFGPDFDIEFLRPALAGLLVGVGAVIAAGSFHRWLNSERALRSNRPLPAPRLAPLLAYGVALVAVLGVVAVLLAR